MQGIERVTARIAHIQATMAAIAPPAIAPPTMSGTSDTSFAAALNNALASTTATSGSTAINADGVPASPAVYGNGKVPEHALSQVGNTRHRLWAPAAESLERLIAAARRDGVTIGITDSYRPYAEQVDLVRRKGLYSQGGLAAKPGTSDHGWGMAADLDLNARAQAWMRANGPKFGFHEDTPREPWHWGFKPTS
ncbi:M15 family metallopeptidase [Actinoplanes sp. NPDC049316]|uniref:M15 family metallopeptidase n=1 Tax=Actinoplanes sp. NPDC049316 TaxID=3154727 RepID=UPI003417E94B